MKEMLLYEGANSSCGGKRKAQLTRNCVRSRHLSSGRYLLTPGIPGARQ